MADISSSIRIEDGFTEPLKNLAKAAWDVESGVTAVTKSLIEQGKEFDSISEYARNVGKEFSISLGERLIGNVDIVLPAIKSVGVATTEMAKTSIKSITEFADLSHGLGVSLAKDITKASFIHPARLYIASIKELEVSTKKYASAGFWGALATMRWNMINKVSMAAFHKMKNSYIKGFNALMESIGKSIDEINIGDKLNAQFGEAGDIARKRSYELANEIGESATMVSELAMKAGQEGIGTEHFERMMKLADKVGKLRQGETTESAANTLMSNIKSGHDASSLAQLYGGGQMMERQLRHAGYERALNRGDLDNALEIAEKIAEQAGLTDENYNKATNNLSQNYKKIMNTIDNVKKRLAETFNRTFAPTIEKIKKLLESNTFKTIVNVADWLMEKLGKFLNWFTETAVDNIHIIGVLLGVGIVSKIMFLVPKLKMILVLAAKLRGPIGWIIGGLTKIIGHLTAIIAKQGVAAIRAKAFAAVKAAAPWAAAGAAIGGILYAIYDCTDATDEFGNHTKTFIEWLNGALIASYASSVTIFSNLFTLIDNFLKRLDYIPRGIKAELDDILYNVDEFTHKLHTGEDHISAPTVAYSEDVYNGMSQEEKDKMVKSAGAIGWKQFEDGMWGLDIDLRKYKGNNAENLRKEILDNETKLLDVEEEVQKVLDSNYSSVLDYIKDLLGLGRDIQANTSGIKTDTNIIRQFNEQEEELKWLKSFSDRQIMSGYSYKTTNNRTTNIYGLSQEAKLEVYRRDRSTIPARAGL